MENNYQTAKKIESLMEGLTYHELILLNQLTAERIRLMQKAGTLMVMSQFRLGDKVSWDSRDGVKYSGVIIRINHKTVSVKVSDKGYWNVSPQMLQKEG
jgi:hypothetical protein